MTTFAHARALLAERGLPSLTITSPGNGTVHLTCHHCGGRAEMSKSDDVEARISTHVLEVCPVTSAFHRKEDDAAGDT